MSYFHWIAGSLLALIWFSRVVDAWRGVRTLADISRPEWDKNPGAPGSNPKVAIIVPARNEEGSIAQALQRLLALDRPGPGHQAVRDRAVRGDHLRRDRDPGAPRALDDDADRPLELVASNLDRARAPHAPEPARARFCPGRRAVVSSTERQSRTARSSCRATPASSSFPEPVVTMTRSSRGYTATIWPP